LGTLALAGFRERGYGRRSPHPSWIQPWLAADEGVAQEAMRRLRIHLLTCWENEMNTGEAESVDRGTAWHGVLCTEYFATGPLEDSFQEPSSFRVARVRIVAEQIMK
jgi:hypothetical protein